jgi:hypothetical protein
MVPFERRVVSRFFHLSVKIVYRFGVFAQTIVDSTVDLGPCVVQGRAKAVIELAYYRRKLVTDTLFCSRQGFAQNTDRHSKPDIEVRDHCRDGRRKSCIRSSEDSVRAL